MSNRAVSFISYLELSKLKIMAPVSLTGLTGYFIYKPALTRELLLVTLGILFTAAAASVLNQIQESEYDRLMDRTRNRPIPSGRITTGQALIYFSIMLIVGLLFMLGTGSLTATLISIFTLAWYNGVYTYLKRKTPFAVIPGALTGALPPLIGWVAAGGQMTDRTIVIIQLLFFAGQIPHFWLFILKYGKEYETAGFPSLTGILERKKIVILILAWIIVLAGVAACLQIFGILHSRITIAVLLAASVMLVAVFIRLVAQNSPNKALSGYSMMLDTYFLLIMVLLVSDRLL